MKILLITALLALSFASAPKDKEQVETVLNDWHRAAAAGDFEKYFGLMAEESVFIGTAPGERWDKKQFMEFSKPYFDRGKAWDFKSVSRHISFSDDGKTAWFDEVLDTWMKDCSGSGVLKKVKGKWLIVFYDLPVLVENEKIDAFLELRK